MDTSEEFLSVTEAAALLGMTRGGVHDAINAGRLPADRIGHGYFLTRRSVETYLARPKEFTPEWFWQQFETLTDSCWEWPNSRTPAGYGRITRKGRQTYTHRVAWELTHGAIPKGMLVLHQCDNPPCCRPDHLFLGTHKDNTQDSIAKGRRPKHLDRRAENDGT